MTHLEIINSYIEAYKKGYIHTFIRNTEDDPWCKATCHDCPAACTYIATDLGTKSETSYYTFLIHYNGIVLPYIQTNHPELLI